MPVNEVLARYSDWSYTTAATVYVLAMLFHLAEQSFYRQPAAIREREAVLVGAGGPEVTTTVSTPAPATPVRAKADRIGRMGVSLLVLGLLLHVTSIVLRALATDRAPWGNMYEYGSLLCLVAVATWLYVSTRFALRRLTAFVLLPIVILMFLGGTVLYTQAAPVQPALQSYWLVIHVSAAASASGILLVPGVASVLYLLRRWHDAKPGRLAKLGPKLPAADVLDRLAYRTTVFAFPIFTFGVICGAIWAESAWGRFWGWDPKETCAFVAWVVYAAYLHARSTAGWRGVPSAIINTLAFAVMVFNLFFINLVTAGLHSYAGVG